MKNTKLASLAAGIFAVVALFGWQIYFSPTASATVTPSSDDGYGTIVGQITADGDAVTTGQVRVHILSMENGHMYMANVNSTGHFTVRYVPAGDFIGFIDALDHDLGVKGAMYGSNVGDDTTLEGGETSDIGVIDLEPGDHVIAGRVTDRVTRGGLSSVMIYTWDYEEDSPDVLNYIPTFTDANGYYRINVDGDVALALATTAFNQADEIMVLEAKTIHFSAGETIKTQNFSVEALRPNHGLVSLPMNGGGPELHLYNHARKLTKSFFAYDRNFRGGVNAISADLDGDDLNETVTIPASNGGPNMRVFSSSGQLIDWAMIAPEGFHGGWQIASGDVDDDGVIEIVVGANAGGGPQVQIWRLENGELVRVKAFFAYQESFRHGIQLAVGDVNGDHRAEIITVPNAGGGPLVSVFDYQGNALTRFFAFQEHLRNGCKLTIADTDGDTIKDIIVVPGAGSPANVAVYSDRGQLKASWFALPKDMTMGVTVAAGDVDGDGLTEIVTTPNAGGGPQVSIFSWRGTLENRFFAYEHRQRFGITAIVADMDGDGQSEIITAPGVGGGPQIGVFNHQGETVERFFAYDERYRGGLKVTANSVWLSATLNRIGDMSDDYMEVVTEFLDEIL